MPLGLRPISSAYPRDEERMLSAEVVAFFFDMNYHDLRRREYRGDFTDVDGEPLTAERGKWNRKLYTLETVRKMAHSLRRIEAIDNRQLQLILDRVTLFESRVGTIRVWKRDPKSKRPLMPSAAS